MKFWLGILGLVWATGCASTTTPQPVSNASKVEPDLLALDRAFADLAQRSGIVRAFSAYLAPQAVKLTPDSPPIEGAEMILKRLGSTEPKISLTWTPRGTDISAAKDLGYTWGTYEVFSRTKSPELLETGTYLSVWKRQPNGMWRVVLDTGTPDSTPQKR